MRKTKEILRLKFDHKMSNRKIAKSCGTSRSVVADYLCRVRKAGLDWLHIAKMNDAEIEAKLFPFFPAPFRYFSMSYYKQNVAILYRELERIFPVAFFSRE